MPDRHQRQRARRVLARLIAAHDRRIEQAERKSDVSRQRVRWRDWRLLDEISVGNDVYLLLHRVQPPPRGLDSLTARELEALRLASEGSSNKEIAYQLSVTPSTVKTLLFRAARRIGAAGRQGLIERYRARRS